MIIATSIAPGNIEKQTKAIQSWRESGFEVVSLNTEDEIDTIGNNIPHIEFVTVKTSTLKTLGRPYVFIDDFLAYCIENKIEQFGIVNSDIILQVGGKKLENIKSLCMDSMLYGCRLDVDESGYGRVYEIGFDYFFMSHHVATKIDRSGFALGAPWWDYYLPLSAALNGVKVNRITKPIGIHVWHASRYSKDERVMLGLEFMRYLKTAIVQKTGVDREIRIALDCFSGRGVDLNDIDKIHNQQQLFDKVVCPGAAAIVDILRLTSVGI